MKNLLPKCAVLVAAVAVCVLSFSGCGHKHTIVEVAQTPSTCIEHGMSSHYRCSECGMVFADAEGNREIAPESLLLPYAEHTYEYAHDENGHWTECAVCGVEEGGAHAPHLLTNVAETEPTATKDGHAAGVHCSECGFVKEGMEVKPKLTPFVPAVFRKLEYCLYEPSHGEGDKLPLVLFLHGAGERGSDNEAQLKNAIGKVVYYGSDSPFMNSVVIAPQCPENKQWVDTPWANGNYTLNEVSESVTMQSVVNLVKYYRNLSYIDEDRIYVVGLSMGGFGAWDLLARHSDLFAAGVTICGGGAIDAVDVLKNIPIYTFHGTADKSVPYAGTQGMVAAIEKAGGTNIRFVTFEGSGHSIWDKAITYAGDEENPAVAQWLFSQKK